MKRINIWKRIASIALCVVMLMTVTACGNPAPAVSENTNQSDPVADTTTAPNTDSEKPKEYVIGVAEAQSSDEVAIRHEYYEKYIGPNYNVKFIFSETLKDEAAGKAFIENCIDSGADAIIDFKNHSEQMARLCEENGLVYTINVAPSNVPELWEGDFPTFAGAINGNNKNVGEMFGDWLSKNADENGEKGILVATVLAPQGNEQHLEMTMAVLEALQEKYDLTYEQPIEEIAVSGSSVNVPNDKNILITLYPGSSNKDTWLPGISSLLQSGKYDVFISAALTYNVTATVVDEVERGLGFDIKVASIGALGDTLKTAFNTKDVFGNPSVNLVVVKSVSILSSSLFALTYNALTGGMDTACRTDGKPAYINFNLIGVESPEQLEQMNGWDERDTGNWIANTDFVDKMLYARNPDLTAVGMHEFLTSMNFEKIQDFVK